MTALLKKLQHFHLCTVIRWQCTIFLRLKDDPQNVDLYKMDRDLWDLFWHGKHHLTPEFYKTDGAPDKKG